MYTLLSVPSTATAGATADSERPATASAPAILIRMASIRAGGRRVGLCNAVIVPDDSPTPKKPSSVECLSIYLVISSIKSSNASTTSYKPF